MPESTAGSAPRPATTKTLVRGSDGRLYVIVPTAAPVPVDPQAKPDPTVQAILDKAEADLTQHFDNSGQPILASGVKIGIAQF
ncbi:MAG TPA: hypothetical protein VHY59_07000 [Chthoniobacterales bacterium]|nr:hypothetical protein [Chthoniobacterales bacterium]